MTRPLLGSAVYVIAAAIAAQTALLAGMAAVTGDRGVRAVLGFGAACFLAAVVVLVAAGTVII